jgi:hypothetical protein
MFDRVGDLAVEVLDFLIDMFRCEELPDMSFGVVIYPLLANSVESAAMTMRTRPEIREGYALFESLNACETLSRNARPARPRRA